MIEWLRLLWRRIAGKPPCDPPRGVEIDQQSVDSISEALAGELRQAEQRHVGAANYLSRVTNKEVKKTTDTRAAIDELAAQLERRARDNEGQ